MDLSSPTRDETPSRHSRRTKTSKSYAESSSPPTPQPKVKKEKTPAKKKKKKSGSLYLTKYQAILAERTEKGQVQYLVNWADDPHTGEVYAPTWEPQNFVLEVGRLQWEEQKREGQVVYREGEFVLKDPENENTKNQPAKRSRDSHSDPSSSSEGQGPSKKPRRAGTAGTARFQSVSQQSLEEAGDKPLEVKDSYEEETLGHPVSTKSVQVRVELSVPAGFDRSVYRAATVEPSSQASQDLQQKDLILQDSVENSSQLEIRRFPPEKSPFLVIPDSQDKVASESYDPSEASGSSTRRTTQEEDNESAPDSNPIEIRSSRPAASSNPESIGGDVEELLDEQVDLTYRDINPNSPIPDSSSGEPPLLTNSAESPQNHGSVTQLSTSSSQIVADSTPSVNANSLSNFNGFSSKVSSQLLTPVREPRNSQEEYPRSGPSQNSRPSQSTGSFPHESLLDSFPHLQPRLPSPNEDEDIGVSDLNIPSSSSVRQSVVNTSASLRSKSSVRSLSPRISTPNSQQSQSQGADRERDQSASTQRSWSENTWNTAQFVSSAPRSHPSGAENTIVSQPVNKALSFVQFSAPSQIDSNAGQSTSGNIIDESLPLPESVRYTTESSQQILQSIEDFDEPVSQPRSSPRSASPESPFRQVVSSYEFSQSSANMDDSAAIKAARRAERKKALDQKIKDEVNKGVAAHRAASSIPPSPVVQLTQPIPLRDVTADEPTIEQHVVEDYAVQERVIEEITVPERTAEAILVAQPHNPPLQSEVYRAESPERLSDTPLEVLPDSDDQYYVPLPLNAIIRDMYYREIKSSYAQRFEFTDEEVLDPELVTKIDEILLKLDLLCSHSDLIAGEYPTQQMATVEARAKFAENRSTKCIFVAELLDAMRNLDKHIAILVRPGRMWEILEAVLRYHKFIGHPHNRAQYVSEGSGSLKVSLIPTGSIERQLDIDLADLVIAFDSTFTEGPYLEDMRFNPNTQTLCPLIHLVVVQSIEHIDKSFSKDIEAIERKIKIVNCLSDILGEVGKLDLDYPDPSNIAQAISEFIAGGANPTAWPCPPLPAIEEDNTQNGISTEADSEDLRNIASGSRTASHTTPAPGVLQSGSKRQLDDDAMDIETPKRQRLTPIPGEEENSNSVAQLSSVPQSIKNEHNGYPGPSVLENSLLASEEALLKEVSDLKAQLRMQEDGEAQVRRLNQNLQSQIKDLSTSIAEIQPKYQAALNDRGEFEFQAKEAIARANRLKQNLDSRNEEITKLKEQKEITQAELASARTLLASSSIPEIAELENLNAEVRTLKLEKERSEKNKLNMKNDLEYMRNNYQIASTSAAESASAFLAVQSELEALRVKASENRVKIHEVQRDNEKATYARMVKQLRIEKTEMARELEKKSNELAAAMNGRRSTRGTSQPMSPRLASPANGAARTLSRVMQSMGPRSRGSSPAEFVTPGGRGFTPLGFGEPLPNGQGFGNEGRFREYRP